MRAPGIHLVHKPVSATSFQILSTFLAGGPPSAKKAPRACHGGTLDPFAEGLLLVLVGAATHLFEPLHALPKEYEAVVRWGVETDNGDPLGRVVGTSDPSSLTAARIEEAAETFRGWHDQIPPSTSAKKVGGEPAYRKVHRGEEVILPPSRVYLHRMEWLEHALPRQSRVRLTSRGGFYVRSFVRDLGRALGTHAHLESLRRTAIGPWRDPGAAPEAFVSGEAALPWCPLRKLTDAEVGALRAGQTIGIAGLTRPTWAFPDGFPLPDPRPIAALHQGRAVALLRQSGAALTRVKTLHPGL